MTQILIVEYDPSVADAVQLLLEAHDYQVQVERDGLNGLARSVQQYFSVIVLDVDLPMLDGMELCRKIRHAKDDTPIILLTGRTHAFDRQEGLKAGANAYLTKPFSGHELIAHVQRLTGSAGRSLTT